MNYNRAAAQWGSASPINYIKNYIHLARDLHSFPRSRTKEKRKRKEKTTKTMSAWVKEVRIPQNLQIAYMIDLWLYFIYMSILEEFLLEEFSASGCSELAIFERVWLVVCIFRFLFIIITAATMTATTPPTAMPHNCSSTQTWVHHKMGRKGIVLSQICCNFG